MIDIIIIAIIVVGIGAVFYKGYRDKKNGKSGCGCGCSGCTSGSCPSKKEKDS